MAKTLTPSRTPKSSGKGKKTLKAMVPSQAKAMRDRMGYDPFQSKPTSYYGAK